MVSRRRDSEAVLWISCLAGFALAIPALLVPLVGASQAHLFPLRQVQELSIIKGETGDSAIPGKYGGIPPY